MNRKYVLHLIFFLVSQISLFQTSGAMMYVNPYIPTQTPEED